MYDYSEWSTQELQDAYGFCGEAARNANVHCNDPETAAVYDRLRTYMARELGQRSSHK